MSSELATVGAIPGMEEDKNVKEVKEVWLYIPFLDSDSIYYYTNQHKQSQAGPPAQLELMYPKPKKGKIAATENF